MVLKLTLHKYDLQPDTSGSLNTIVNNDEFYVTMNSILHYSVTITDSIYSITSQITVDPYYEALLPLNAFKKFNGAFTIYGPSGFKYEVKDISELKIKPADVSSIKAEIKPLYDNLKALNGRPPDPLVTKVNNK